MLPFHMTYSGLIPLFIRLNQLPKPLKLPSELKFRNNAGEIGQHALEDNTRSGRDRVDQTVTGSS